MFSPAACSRGGSACRRWRSARRRCRGRAVRPRFRWLRALHLPPLAEAESCFAPLGRRGNSQRPRATGDARGFTRHRRCTRHTGMHRGLSCTGRSRRGHAPQGVAARPSATGERETLYTSVALLPSFSTPGPSAQQVIIASPSPPRPPSPHATKRPLVTTRRHRDSSRK